MSAKQKTLRIGYDGMVECFGRPYIMRDVSAALGIPRTPCRLRVIAAPLGRFSLRSSKHVHYSSTAYVVYDHRTKSLLNFGCGWLCRDELRAALHPLPVRIGQRYNLKVLPA